MSFQAVDEVVGIVTPDVFYTKVIDCKCELYGLSGVFPESRCMWDLVVTGQAESLFEELVGQDASLWEAIDCFATLDIDISIFRMLVEVILVD